MRVVVMFSGQGAQQSTHYEELQLTVHEEYKALLYEPLFSHSSLSEKELSVNSIAQPLITAIQLSRWQRFSRQLTHAPLLIAGYSAGETASYYAAGVWSDIAALQIARTRAHLMDSAVGSIGTCAMAYLEHSDDQWIQKAMIQHQVYEAIRLPHGGAVIAGLHKHLLAFEQQVLTKSDVMRWLPISIPSHTPLLHTVEQSLFEYLSTLPWSIPTIPLLAGGSASVMSSPEELARAFCYQTCHTLNWQHCLSVISEYRPDVVLEIGPGNALAIMIRELDSSIMARSIDEFSHDEAVLDWLQRWG